MISVVDPETTCTTRMVLVVNVLRFVVAIFDLVHYVEAKHRLNEQLTAPGNLF